MGTPLGQACGQAPPNRIALGNFRLNDEMCSTLQQAWQCAMRLDSQLGEADRPREERNRWLQQEPLQGDTNLVEGVIF